MLPILFHIGSMPVYSYGVLVAGGVLLGLWYARREAAKHGLNPDDVWNIGIYMVLVALIMAKIWLVLSAWDYYRANPREIFSMTVIQSGGTFYGGVVGAMATIIIYTYAKKIPILPLLDTFAFAVPLGHSIGRLGCLTGWLLLWQVYVGALGDHVQERIGRTDRRDAAPYASSSHAALRIRRGISEFSDHRVACAAPAIYWTTRRHLFSSLWL